MNKLLLVILLSTNIFCINFEVLDEVRVLFVDKLEELKKISDMKQQTSKLQTLQDQLIKNKNYDLCLAQLEKTLDSVVELTREILKKDIYDIVAKSLRLSADIVDSIDCFMHPPSNLSEGKIKCIIYHLKRFGLVMRQMFRDLYEKKLDKASVDLQKGIEILQEMINTC